jgi:hypothetical protein
MIVHISHVHSRRLLKNLDSWNEAFKVIACVLNVPKCSCRVHTRVANDNLRENFDFENREVKSKNENYEMT